MTIIDTKYLVNKHIVCYDVGVCGGQRWGQSEIPNLIPSKHECVTNHRLAH